MTTPSIDSMLGIINNNSQTATLIEGQRNVSDNIKTLWKETYKAYLVLLI